MKAIIKETSRPGAILKEWPMPTLGPNEVLIKIKAAAICGTDLHIFEWNDWAKNSNIKLPIALGHECCGEVVGTGKLVKNLKVGDYVACETHISCGECYQCTNGMQHICKNLILYGVNYDGCFAEYTKIPEPFAVKISKTIKPEIGAVFEPLGTAVRACNEADVSGKNIAIMGCGPIGLMAINVAKAFGAANIVGIDIQAQRLNIAKKLGATLTINALKQDSVAIMNKTTNQIGIDVFIDASGNTGAILDGFKALRKGGTVILVGLPSNKLKIDLGSQIVFKEAKVKGIHGRKMFDTWTIVSNLLDKELIDIEPVITHIFKLEEYEKGLEVIKNGEGCKVILIP